MQQDLKFELEQDILINQVGPYKFIDNAHTNSIESMDSSPDGKFFASGSHDHNIKIWDLQTAKQTVTLSDHKQGVWSLDYSLDGNKLLSASPDTTIVLWDQRKKSPGSKFLGHKDKVYSAKFNQSNKLIASVGQGGEVLIWDVSKNNAPIKTLKLGTFIGYDIEWSKNQQILIIPTLGSTIYAFDAKTFQTNCQDTISQNKQSKCESVVANFNAMPGRIFTATERGHIVWHQYKDKSMKKITQFVGHKDACRCVALHKKQRLLLSSAKDGSVRLWDCKNNGHPQIKANLVHHGQNVTNVRFATEQIIITGSWDQSIGMWKLKDLLK